MSRVAALLLLVGAAGAALVGCNAISDRLLPTEPTATPSATPAPIAVPVVLPKPTPTPTLAPGPTPSPTPNPNPTPAPTGGTCSLPASNTPDAPCAMGSNSFLGQVDKAITLVTQQQPGIFDFDNKKCDNCY